MESQRKDNRSHETAEKSACVNTMSKKKTLLLPPSLVFGASHSKKQPEKIAVSLTRHKSP
jgi:hypothetical protein